MCSVHGYLLNGCPYNCEDYEDMFGNTEKHGEEDS